MNPLHWLNTFQLEDARTVVSLVIEFYVVDIDNKYEADFFRL